MMQKYTALSEMLPSCTKASWLPILLQEFTVLREMLPSSTQTSCFPFLDSGKNIRGKEWKAKTRRKAIISLSAPIVPRFGSPDPRHRLLSCL